MHLVAKNGIGTVLCGLAGMGLLALTAGGASAQIVFDGNVLFNNNASGTLVGQFSGTAPAPPCPAGLTAGTLGTTTYTHNILADPLLPDAPYKPNVLPNFRPGLGSAAYTNSVRVPSDGFFEQTCYAGALGANALDDWTQGWTYYDSTGAGRQDLHLATMPDPRPLAVYPNINILGCTYFSPDSNYLVRGQLRIKNGGQLTIAPGVVVFEERATLGTIIAERGGRVYAIGNKCEPIIITSDDAPGSMTRGAGGGIILNGRAKTNLVNSCAGDSAASEGGAVGFYGGNDDNDCSGILRYVRVEFAGKEITPNNELNSFTFNTCGHNTHGDYLEAYQGADDGFEWFGGAMDQKYLIAIDGTDDGYDWQMGTRNRSQFVIIRVSPFFAPSGSQNGDKGIEADDNEFDFNAVQCSGRSNTTVANFTIIGDKRVGPTFPGPTSGVNFRRGTAGSFLNGIVYNMKTAALKIDDNDTWIAHCAAPPAAPAQFCPGALGVTPVASGNVFVAQGAPNPFRSKVNINFVLPKSGRVVVEIYAADGRRVETLVNGELQAGQHSLPWNLNKETPSGVYFYRVLADGVASTGKVTRVD